MRITRSGIDTQKGPADWFTGDVYIDAVARGHVDLPLLNGRRGACPGRAGDAEQLFELADGVLAAAVQRDQASTLNNSRPTGSVGSCTDVPSARLT